MKKLLLALLLLALLSGAALLALWIAFGATAGDIHLIVNGDEIDLSHLGGWHAAAGGIECEAAPLSRGTGPAALNSCTGSSLRRAAAGGMAGLLALCVVALVVPLALALGVVLPLLLGAVLLVCAAALGVGALALSPLLLLVLLVWWLSRRSPRAAATGSGAGRTTIDA